ncbi:MAG: NADP(H)-dependent aldo-keto reductase [Betaproteobacteria bacterium]|nr:NADP(H)-dependent aldo-keto reductase [Betaproteobacteria bacterium]
MEYRQLGHSDLRVSALALGTMTFGEQNTEADAHEQLDYSVSRGVNFIDTAEMYPVPPRKETVHSTESYVGSWLKRQARSRLIVATKATGANRGFEWIRGGPRVSRDHLGAALDGSLKRLQTDYIDLYQIHWPDRYVPMFGATRYDAAAEKESVPIEEQLAALGEFVRAGKIRYVGVSNETAWGVCEFVHTAERMGLPTIVSIQNAYHLMNRTFEHGLAEVCRHANIGLLAYSPLAFGCLTGKYMNAEGKGRVTIFPGFAQRYQKPNAAAATAQYVHLAQEAGLEPAQMALAFVRSRGFVTSTLVGATSMAQLKSNLDSMDLTLSPDVLARIDDIHERIPNPTP